MASILFPKLQKHFNRANQIEERKIKITEDIIKNFNSYIVSWRRLIQISTQEKRCELNEEERDRKNGFVVERNGRRDSLLDNLKLCHLYFSEALNVEIERFIEWDESLSAMGLDELPEIEAWREWESQIVGLIRNEIRG